MPSDFMLKSMNGVHRTLLKLSGGRIGWTAAKMPVLELTTVGRKSGESRSVMLTSPIQDGGSMVIVASKGGDDHPPAWLLNLQANQHVYVATNGNAKQPMIARVATAEERDRLWPQITASFERYGRYQSKTAREIPLVFLDAV